MKPAAESMSEKIKNTNFTKPKFDIINNVKALPETEAENIKSLLTTRINQVKYSLIHFKRLIFLSL